MLWKADLTPLEKADLKWNICKKKIHYMIPSKKKYLVNKLFLKLTNVAQFLTNIIIISSTSKHQNKKRGPPCLFFCCMVIIHGTVPVWRVWRNSARSLTCRAILAACTAWNTTRSQELMRAWLMSRCQLLRAIAAILVCAMNICFRKKARTYSCHTRTLCTFEALRATIKNPRIKKKKSFMKRK